MFLLIYFGYNKNKAFFPIHLFINILRYMRYFQIRESNQDNLWHFWTNPVTLVAENYSSCVRFQSDMQLNFNHFESWNLQFKHLLQMLNFNLTHFLLQNGKHSLSFSKKTTDLCHRRHFSLKIIYNWMYVIMEMLCGLAEQYM